MHDAWCMVLPEQVTQQGYSCASLERSRPVVVVVVMVVVMVEGLVAPQLQSAHLAALPVRGLSMVGRQRSSSYCSVALHSSWLLPRKRMVLPANGECRHQSLHPCKLLGWWLRHCGMAPALDCVACTPADGRTTSNCDGSGQLLHTAGGTDAANSCGVAWWCRSLGG